eukprot:260033_1
MYSHQICRFYRFNSVEFWKHWCISVFVSSVSVCAALFLQRYLMERAKCDGDGATYCGHQLILIKCPCDCVGAVATTYYYLIIDSDHHTRVSYIRCEYDI